MSKSRISPVSVIALVASVLALVLVLWNTIAGGSQLKVGFVRSNDLIGGYLGTKECQQMLERTTQQIKANIDTLSQEHQQTLNAYERDLAGLSANEQDERRRAMSSHEGELAEYAANAQQQMKNEEAKLMQGVLNQINSFAEKYGKEHGYDLILGTTASGSLLYAEQSTDITDELLQALNASYSGNVGLAQNKRVE